MPGTVRSTCATYSGDRTSELYFAGVFVSISARVERAFFSAVADCEALKGCRCARGSLLGAVKCSWVRTQIHTHKDKHTHTNTSRRTHTNTSKLTNTSTHTNTRTHTLTQMHTHKQNTHTHKDKYTQTPTPVGKQKRAHSLGWCKVQFDTLFCVVCFPVYPVVFR